MVELSSRYAHTLFDLAKESGALEEFAKQAHFIREILKSEDCRRVLDNPMLSNDEKRDFITDILAGNVHNDLAGLLYMLITKRNESLIVPALTSFINMVSMNIEKTDAHVVSAVELDEKQIKILKNTLQKKINKQVHITVSVDKTLIGGLQIHVDGYLIDRSVKKQLEDLKENLKEVL